MRFSYTYYSGDDYDNLVKKFDNYSLLQSHKWGKIKEEDWNTKRVVFYDGDEIAAVASILIRRIFSNKNFIYIPYGPLMDYNNKELLDFVTNSFKEIAKDNNAIYLKIVPPIFNDNSISKDLIANGWIENKTDKSFDSIQPKLNAVVHNDFKLTKRMKQDRRTTENKNVRSVYTFDFKVKELSDNLLNDFYELTRLTEKRLGIKLRNKDYFKSLLDNYPNSFVTVSYIERNKRADKLIEELKADNDKDKKVLRKELWKIENTKYGNLIPISGTLTVVYGDTAELLYAGFDDDFKSYNSAAYSWTNSILKTFERFPNIKYVNLGGVENEGSLLNFKKKFHPEIRESYNEFDLPVSKLYYLIKFALKHKKTIRKFIKK